MLFISKDSIKKELIEINREYKVIELTIDKEGPIVDEK